MITNIFLNRARPVVVVKSSFGALILKVGNGTLRPCWYLTQVT